MIGRKSVVGVAVLFALALGAFAADAFGEQRAYYCADNAGKEDYNDQHCTTSVGSGNGTKGQEEMFEGINSVTATNLATASETNTAAVSKLKGALSGVVTEVQCTGLSGSGLQLNEPTYVIGEGTISYTGCTVTQPAGKGCVVSGGAITTNEIEVTTFGQAANKLFFAPAPGETSFATVPIASCSIPALNNSFPVTGSFVADVSGATTTTTHAGITAQNTLKFGGVKAGIEGAITFRWAGVVPVTLT